MARIRSVKPELRTSLVVAEWPREVRYFWVLMWGYLDDHGRGVDDARLIKADCLPLDDDVTRHMIDEWVGLIVKDGPLCRYEVNGKRYVHAPSWTEHQRPSHPAASRVPPCPRHGGSGGSPEGFGSPSGEPREDRRDASAEQPVDNEFPQAKDPRETLARTSGDTPETLAPEQVVRAGSREQGPGSANESRTDDTRTDVEQICAHLADKIAANGSKRPGITDKWRNEARLLLDRDGRTPAEVIRVIDWCQNDTFWRPNVMSMPKLREKFDQLRLASQRNQRDSRNRNSGWDGPYLNPPAEAYDAWQPHERENTDDVA